MTISSNQKLSKESYLKRVFNDPKNYPYGFSRSGDFSIAESKALSSYGCYIAALADGHLMAENDEDSAFLAVIHGKQEPTDTAQRAWLKYQKRINRPKTGSIYGTKKASTQDDDDNLVTDMDGDIDLDID